MKKDLERMDETMEETEELEGKQSEETAEKKQHDEAVRQAEAIADGEAVDWQAVLKEWNEYYAQNPEENQGE